MDTEAAYKYVRDAYYESARAARRVGTYQAAQALAKKYGGALADALGEAFDLYCPDGAITLEEALALIPRSLRMNYDRIANIIASVQEDINTELGIGLNPIAPAFDSIRAENMANQIADAGTGIIDQMKKEVENFSMTTVDDGQRLNAEFLDGAGFETLVTRVYDGVGVNHRKDVCEWCLERCGTDVPVAEAISMGMFERHTGCGCTITYKTHKKTTVQGRDMIWREAPADLERRKTIGL